MVNLLIAFLVSMLISLLLIPILIRIASDKNLFVQENYRRTHKGKISSLGGIAIIFASFFSFMLFEHSIDYMEVKTLFAAFFIMFLIGVRDDLKSVNAYIKLLGQLIVGFLLVWVSNYRILNLGGLFGVYELPPMASFCVSLLILIFIINAYNFTDGIDLQAGLQALVFLLPIGLWFQLNDQFDYALLSLSLSGAILAFIYFNFPPSKIFLGDTGTMLIGLILVFVGFRFINLNESQQIKLPVHNSMIVIFGTFSLFILDVFRVAMARVYKGKSPFTFMFIS